MNADPITNAELGQLVDRADKHPASPGRLTIVEAGDHTPEFGSYELVAHENQHECVARVHTCCGRERANAERLARGWNHYPRLIEIVQSIADEAADGIDRSAWRLAAALMALRESQ